MHIPTRIVAGVGQVTFEVVDRLGNPVADVGLAGSGSAGGVVDDVTDDAGRLTIAGLPAGSYRVAATHGDRQRGFETFELNAGEHPIVRIVLE
jgi:hypothetical protein